jgi:type III secretory pathway component EscT
MPSVVGLLLGFFLSSPVWSEHVREWLVRQPLTNHFYEMAHFPAVGLVNIWAFIARPSEGVAAWAALPFAVIIQWVMVGVAIGVVLQLRFRASHHAKEIS